MTASSVLPPAISTATQGGVPTERFTISAPSATPGQRRGPKSTSAAIDSPVGGQTSVALVCTWASSSPSRPRAT